MFFKKISIKKSLNNINKLCHVLKIGNDSNSFIIKLYRLLRNKNKKAFDLVWYITPLSLEPADKGYPCVEIDKNLSYR